MITIKIMIFFCVQQQQLTYLIKLKKIL